jgi:hypothetical protein
MLFALEHKRIEEKMQLQDLKRAFEKSKHDVNLYKTLSEKRELKIERAFELKESVSRKLIEMHRIEKRDPQRADALKKEILEEGETIDELKKSLLEIDHQLDELESALDYEEIRKNLITTIQKEYPEDAQAFEQHETQLKAAQKTREEALKHQQLLAPLSTLFQEGQAIKLKGGFFNFLFEKNPKARLARIIHAALEQAEKIAPQIGIFDIKNFLKNFITAAKHTPNRSLYEGGFSDFSHQLAQLMEHLNHTLVQSETSIKSHEEAIEQWINKHTL